MSIDSIMRMNKKRSRTCTCINARRKPWDGNKRIHSSTVHSQSSLRMASVPPNILYVF